jgi:hypothetical protein
MCRSKTHDRTVTLCISMKKRISLFLLFILGTIGPLWAQPTVLDSITTDSTVFAAQELGGVIYLGGG